MKDEVILKKYTLNEHTLKEIGFIKENNIYKYESKILNDLFLLRITITEDNTVTSDVIELETSELFLPYYATTHGEFTGKMKDEYNKIISKILFFSKKDVYKNSQTKELLNYILKKYNDKLEFLWDDDNAIIRNSKNNKWYSVLMLINKKKLGLPEDEIIEVMNLHLEPSQVEEIVDNKKYFRGFHMNKKHWITVKLDNSVKTEELYKLIDISYNLSINKK